jgi:hypothetical protein
VGVGRLATGGIGWAAPVEVSPWTTATMAGCSARAAATSSPLKTSPQGRWMVRTLAP